MWPDIAYGSLRAGYPAAGKTVGFDNTTSHSAGTFYLGL